MLVGHIQGSWGTEVPAHQTSRSPPLPRGGRGGAVLLRVVVALPFNYCSVRTLKGSLRPHLTPHISFFRLCLIRIPHVRWSLGFMPGLVFGLAFGLGGGSSRGGQFGPRGRHTLLCCLATESRWLCRVHGYLADADKKKQNKKKTMHDHILS